MLYLWYQHEEKTKAKPSMEPFHSLSRKSKFGLAGILNVLATNMLLQLLLRSEFFSTGVATLISQVFNGCFGYAVYGGWVFRSRKMRKIRSSFLYGVMMLSLWCVNTVGIELLTERDILGNRNIAALIMVMPLAITSYLLQKNYIFRSTLGTP